MLNHKEDRICRS